MNRKIWFKRLNTLIKLSISILLFFTIYKQVFANAELKQHSTEMWNSLLSPRVWYLLVVFALTFVNWGAEAVKWKLLINRLERMSFYQSYKAVLLGVSLSMVLPNQVGEFTARVFYLKKANKIKAAFLTVINSYIQLVVALALGGLAMLLYTKEFNPQWLTISTELLLVLWFLGLCVAFLIYFNFQNFNKWLSSIPIFKKALRFTEVWALVSRKQLVYILLWSILRYSVMVGQYGLMMHIFSIEATAYQCFTIVGTIFLIQSIVPGFALLKLGVRGKAAVTLMQVVAANGVAALAASYGLWLINLAIPAIIGALIMLKVKFIK